MASAQKSKFSPLRNGDDRNEDFNIYLGQALSRYAPSVPALGAPTGPLLVMRFSFPAEGISVPPTGHSGHRGLMVLRILCAGKESSPFPNTPTILVSLNSHITSLEKPCDVPLSPYHTHFHLMRAMPVCLLLGSPPKSSSSVPQH